MLQAGKGPSYSEVHTGGTRTPALRLGKPYDRRNNGTYDDHGLLFHCLPIDCEYGVARFVALNPDEVPRMQEDECPIDALARELLSADTDPVYKLPYGERPLPLSRPNLIRYEGMNSRGVFLDALHPRGDIVWLFLQLYTHYESRLPGV